MSLAENSVTIDLWQANYRIPRQYQAPERLKGLLDDAANRLARETLDAALLPLVSAEGESVWLINRLELELAVNTSWDLDQIAATWARRIARQLDRIFQAGPDGVNVFHFPDWAAYLAYFLGDLVEGQAWSRWYYQAFEGLRPLSASAAIRTAILEDPMAGFQALLRLPTDRLKHVVETLSESDARRVLDGLGLGSPSADEWVSHFLLACEQANYLVLEEEQFALRVFLETGRALGQVGGPGLAAAARGAARLRQRLAGGSGARLSQALLALAAGRGSLADLYTEAGPADAERLFPLVSLPPDRLMALLTTLSGGPVVQADAESTTGPPRRYTSFGGVFFLLPELDRMPLAQMLEGFPDLKGESVQAALRLLLLVRAGGRSRAPLHFYDPLLRDLAGVGPQFTPTAAAAWLNRVPRPAWSHFMSALHEMPQDAAGLGLVQIPLVGRSALALVNLQDGAWLALLSLDPSRQSHWQALRPLLIASPNAPWVGDPDLLAAARRETGLAGPAGSYQPDRLAQVPEDLKFLLAPADWGLSRPVDLALALAAQRLLRRLSQGLGGFQQSGLPYLFTNFLDFTAGLDEEPDRRTVFLGRPPLALVLQRAGKLRQTYRLGWGDGRKFDLYPET